MDFAEQVRVLPDEPGVYLFYDSEGKILYIGKAKRLKRRVQAYLHPERDGRVRIPELMHRVHHLEVVVTDTETEALLLEQELIYRHKPPYNVLFRHSRSHVFLRIRLSTPFPPIEVVKKIRPKDRAVYLGPFPSPRAVRETLEVVERHFQLRSCSDEELRRRKRPCLLYQLGRCSAPCVGLDSEAPYRERVEGVIRFFQGRTEEVLATLRSKMEEASEQLRFEVAAKYRDAIRAIETTVEKQKVVQPHSRDVDVFAVYHQQDKGVVQGLFLRRGRILSATSELVSPFFSCEAALASYVKSYYLQGGYLPDEVYLSHPIEDLEALQRWLSEQKGRKVSLFVPKRGRRREVVELALKNGVHSLSRLLQEERELYQALEELREVLQLPRLPYTIECFDISNLQGAYAVASKVRFERGEPDKSLYRRYKIHYRQGPNDLAMMAEVLTRRLARAKEESLPDLIVLDGGRGQLQVGLKVWEDFGLTLEQQPLIALAKSRPYDRAEKIYVPWRQEPLRLSEGSAGLRLLVQVRDEAHRFALTYHRKRRSMEILREL